MHCAKAITAPIDLKHLSTHTHTHTSKQTHTRLHQSVVTFLQVIVGPEKMIVVPPRHYCVVENPAMKDKDGKPVFDTHGQVSTLPFTHSLIHSLTHSCTYV